MRKYFILILVLLIINPVQATFTINVAGYDRTEQGIYVGHIGSIFEVSCGTSDVIIGSVPQGLEYYKISDPGQPGPNWIIVLQVLGSYAVTFYQQSSSDTYTMKIKIENQYQADEDEIQDYLNQIKDLQNQITNLNTQIENYKTTINSKNIEVNNLKNEKKNLSEKVDDLEEEIKTLKNDIANYKADTENYKEQYETILEEKHKVELDLQKEKSKGQVQQAQNTTQIMQLGSELQNYKQKASSASLYKWVFFLLFIIAIMSNVGILFLFYTKSKKRRRKPRRM